MSICRKIPELKLWASDWRVSPIGSDEVVCVGYQSPCAGHLSLIFATCVRSRFATDRIASVETGSMGGCARAEVAMIASGSVTPVVF